MSENNNIIELKNISKSFGKKIILDNMNYKIVKGKTTILMGLSGTGKSVTLKIILGLIKEDSGEVFYKNNNISNLSKNERKNILKDFGMVFQNGALFDSLTMFENVAFPLRNEKKYSEKEIEEKVLNILDLVGLQGGENKLPAELSGGMIKRVGLARALVYNPEVMLYDEPTTGLDPVMSDVIENLIENMQEKYSHTNIIISHSVKSSFRLGDYIAFLYKGKILEYGTPEEISKSTNPILQQFLKGSSKGPIKLTGDIL